MPVRVRFAPSPTGRLHIGSLRDALFKFLMARHEPGGVNILRIEDTDRARYSQEAEEDFLEALAWVGIDYDEGPHVGGPHAPYHQSARKERGIYAEHIAPLLERGEAYKAFDTPEELAEMRETQEQNKLQVGYFGGMWRDAPPERVAAAEAEGRPFVIRQKIPRGRTIAIEDAVRGRIEWDSDTVDDPVLIKADGMPTYHFAAMVDDHLMGITHIMRGEEWIASAPKHAALFDAFGWERPVFVHCPVIKGKSGKKLSKRDGDVSVLDYREKGYLPEAIVNFIALIGWAPGGDREILTRQEMIAAFSIDGIQPSPGLFDLEKLRWMNGHYVRQLAPEELLETVRQYLERPSTLAFWEDCPQEEGEPEPRAVFEALTRLREGIRRDPAYALEVLKLEQERVTTLADFGPAGSFFFEDLPKVDEKAAAKWLTPEHVPALFHWLIAELAGRNRASVETCEALVRGYAEAQGLEKLGPVVHPIRVALTGKTAGPGLFELMSLLGPARMIERVRAALGGR